MGVSDRRLLVQLTQEAKIASDFSLFRAIFAFAGFVSALRAVGTPPYLSSGDEKPAGQGRKLCKQGNLHRSK